MATTMVKPELHPVPDKPKENLHNYCRTVGFDERDFIELPHRPGVFIAALDVAPAQFAAIEEASAQHGGHNRTLRKQAAEQYRHSMNTGGFDFTGQTFIISGLWNLLDGHHRADAGRSAEKSAPMLIVFGIADALFDIIDNSVSRSLADNMELAGQGRTAWLAAGINMILTAERAEGNPIAKLKVSITPRERRQFVEDHPELTSAKDAALAIQEVIPIPLPEMVYVLFLARRLDTEKTRTFVESVISGAEMPATDPRLVYREWCLRAAQKPRKTAPKRKENLQALIKAVKTHFAGGEMKRLETDKKDHLPTLE